jgi:hypothetical protein
MRSVRQFLRAVCGLMPVLTSHCRADDFAIRDGDTVVLLDESITAARTYGKTIENYTPRVRLFLTRIE